MAPEEESKPEAPRQDAPPGPKAAPRRDRRPGRGRRGRGRGGRPPKPSLSEPTSSPAPEAPNPRDEPEPIFELAGEASPEADTRMPAVELTEHSEEAPAAPAGLHPSQSASPVSVEKAIEEVSAVIDTLRGALDDMDELLEMLEMFERQKNADEREIESLRRALRQIHRPRDAGHHPHR